MLAYKYVCNLQILPITPIVGVPFDIPEAKYKAFYVMTLLLTQSY